MSPEEIDDALATRLRAEEQGGIVSAYLFGSQAEERSHRESDVDLGVLLRREKFRTPRERFDQRLRLTSRLAGGLGGRSLDLLILNDTPPQLARRIVTRGRRVFCSDPEADHAFVRDVQLRAADLEPFLRRMREIKRRALSRP